MTTILNDDRTPVDYYVYYSTAASGDEAIGKTVSRIREMLRAIEDRTGVPGKVMRRRDDPATLMEIYLSVEDPVVFETELQAQVDAFGISALVAPGTARHVERFIQCV